MPWTAGDAASHTKKAKGGKKARQWAHVVNAMLAAGRSEGAAVRGANAVVKGVLSSGRRGALSRGRG